jgi:outer membrane lipoprotein-sorting protein
MKTVFFLVAMCLTVNITSLKAQQMTGLQIMQENDRQFHFKTEVSQMTMELINSSNRTRSRTVERFSMKDENGNLSTLIRFLQPADVRGTGFLSIEHNENEESRHLFLPALRRTRRISAGEDSDSFMGSDFTYEDIAQMVLDEYSFNLLGNEVVNETNCYKIEVIPTCERRKRITAYSKMIYYVSHNNFIVHKVEYYDRHGTLFKTLTGTDIRLVPGTTDFYRAYTLTMENLRTGHRTVLRYSDFKINSEVDKDMFTLRFLERGI